MNDEQKDYTLNLTETITSLIDFEGKLFTDTVNVLMRGELKSVNDVFDNGDGYYFTLHHFQSSKDINVVKLAELIISIRKTVDFLREENNIGINNDLDLKYITPKNIIF